MAYSSGSPRRTRGQTADKRADGSRRNVKSADRSAQLPQRARVIATAVVASKRYSASESRSAALRRPHYRYGRSAAARRAANRTWPRCRIEAEGAAPTSRWRTTPPRRKGKFDRDVTGVPSRMECASQCFASHAA
jgi:hypothetical protein